jgi:D-sedoheptulose 7-phosphate isomerase
MYSQYKKELQDVLIDLNDQPFNNALDAIVSALKNEKSIYIFGNGGSSATASHFVVDWKKGTGMTLGVSAPVYCLTDNVPLLTAFANDVNYESVFAEIMSISAKKGDIAFAISGSGNSENVIKGLQKAKEIGCFLIGLTGFDGGEVGKIVDINCHVPSFNMQIVEDIHSTFGHSVLQSIKKNIF